LKRLFLIVLIFFAVFGGCSNQQKTKEQLVNEGSKLMEQNNPGGAAVLFKNALEKDPNYVVARFQLAKAYYAFGKLDASEKELLKVLKQDPSSRDAHLELSRVMANTHRPDEALKEIAPYIGENYADCDALEVAGLAYAAKNDYPQAVSLLKRSVAACSTRTEPILSLASVYAMMGNTQVAQKDISDVLAKEPANRKALYLLIEIQSRQKDIVAALSTLDRLIKAYPSDIEAQYRKGLMYIENKDYDKGLVLSEAVIKQAPQRPEGYRLKGFTLFYLQKFSDAVTALQISLQLRPNAGTYYILGLSQYYLQEGELAISKLQKALEIDPHLIQARVQLAMILLSKQRTDDAIKEARTVLDADEKNAAAHNILGSAYLTEGKYAEGIAELNMALQLDPSIKEMQYYTQQGEQAISQLQTALEMDPHLIQARVQLAMIFLNEKRTDDAIKEARTVLDADEKNAAAHNILGSAYLTKGNYAQGIAELNKALQLDPSLSEIHVKKGIIAMQRGMGQEAESEFVAAVRIKPESRDTRRILALYYMNHNKLAKAIDVLKKGLQGGPADAVSYYLIAESYIKQNNINEARASLNKAKEASPTYDLAYIKLASIDFTEQKQEEGIMELQSLLDKSPDNVQALLLLASLAEENGDEHEARRNYLRAADTGKTEGIIAAAQYLQRTKDSDQAIKVLEEGIKRTPSDINLLVAKGEALFTEKKFSDALSNFEAVEKINHQIGFGLVVKTLLAMGEKAAALDNVESEIKAYPNNLSLRAERSAILLLMGKTTDAVENARGIIRKNPESAVGYLELANVYKGSNQMSKAIETLKNCPKRKEPEVMFMLGNLYIIQKNYVAALNEFSKIEAMKAGTDQVLFQKGNVLNAMGKKKEAIGEYKKVISLSPNHAMALNNLAYLYIEEKKDAAQALLYAQRAFMIAPQNDQIRDTLGYALIKNDKIDRGIIMLKKAAENSPKDPSILYHLALAYKEHGDTSSAVKELQNAIALGDFAEATDAKSLLGRMMK
jgi:tetratricopeptide (TPR) repeat protein